MTQPALMRISHITKVFTMGDTTLRALDDINLEIKSGEFVAIVGPSGSGKSTLMHVLGLLDAPTSGTYELGGNVASGLSDEDLAALRSRSIGFIFQQFNLLARTSAAQNVGLPMLYSGKPYDDTWALKLLEAVGIGNRSDHHPSQLSGGQQQRVAIARALVNKPLLILADEPTGNLDSQSEKDILEILVRLNQLGATVVIVTHEQEVTQIAKRVIRMRDGKVVADDIQEPKYLDGMNLSPKKSALDALFDHSHDGDLKRPRFMKLRSHLSEAARAIMSNKIRSTLSILGILIGVAAVIAMLGLGEGAKRTMEAELSSLGSNLLVVYPGTQRSGASITTGNFMRITLDDVDALKKGLDHTVAVAGRVNGRGQVQFGEKNWTTTINGAPTEYAEMRANMPTIGRNFTAAEDRARGRVALIGKTVIKNIFGDQEALGAQIKINRVYFEVIGILPEKGSNGFQDQDDNVVIPLETAMRRVLGNDFVSSIDIQVDDQSNVSVVEDEIRRILGERKRYDEDQSKELIQVRNMSEIRDAISSTSKIMSTLLAIVASISLVVGGIGVMNIMLVSVTERTREIGLRKALGATSTDIMTQFLVEATFLSLFGGAVGVLVGWGIAQIAATMTEWSFVISTFAVLSVTSITAIVGIIFGFWPALKASRLAPIVALKYE